MISKTMLIHGGWAIAAGLAFALGSMSGGGSGDSGAGEGGASAASGSGSGSFSRGGAGSGDAPPRTGNRTAGERDSGMLDRLFGSYTLDSAGMEKLAEQAFTDANPIKRRLAFSRLLESMTPENASAIREQLTDLGASRDQWRDFHYSWGALSGKEAFDFAAESDEVDLRATMMGWAAANPDEAIATLDDLPEELRGQSEDLTEGVVAGVADHDQAAATELVERFAEEGRDDTGDMIRIIAHEALRGGDPAAVSAWAESLSDDGLKSSAMDRVAAEYVREDAEAAASWVENHADQDYAARAVAEVGGEWAERDPSAAVGWLENLPEGEGQRAGLGSAFGDWEDSDPAAASEYLMSMPQSEKRDSAISGFARGYAWEDPQTAITWAQDISDPNLRQESLTRAGRVYFRRDPQAAMEWMENSGFSQEMREELMD